LPGGHGALARLLPMARGEAELPGFFTQFKSHKQHGLGCVTMLIVGRCGCHRLSPPWDRLRVMEKKLTNSGPLRASVDKHSIYTMNVSQLVSLRRRYLSCPLPYTSAPAHASSSLAVSNKPMPAALFDSLTASILCSPSPRICVCMQSPRC